MTRRYSARREVSRKSDHAIQRETAHKWAARAVACYRRYAREGTLAWLLRAEQYRHEAIEHASGAGDGGKLVGDLERKLERRRPKEARGV